MEVFRVNATEPTFGAFIGEVDLHVHDSSVCVNQGCCIHHPSDHHMKDWPMLWRGDRHMMERMCPHEVGHPDPDDVAFFHLWNGAETTFYYSVHGCDGCCFA